VKENEPTKWATAGLFMGSYHACTIARFARSSFLRCGVLGFRFAPPQALCFHPLRGL